MTKKRLIIFTRYPVAGKTKTRMISALGEQGSADLHREMTEYTLRNLLSLGSEKSTEIEVYYSDGNLSLMKAWLNPVILSFSANNSSLKINPIFYHAQANGDLGKRMQRAFEEAFNDAIEQVIIIGTDCPDLSEKVIQDAFMALNSHNVVLGPASDGGYYLIGLNKLFPALFENIDWGSDRVLAQTKRIIKQQKLSAYYLPILTDVDRPNDLWVWEKVKNNPK